MSEKRIQFNNIVKNQLPSYVTEEFPLISEFLSQYYISQEFQGAPVDLIQNIDTYIKIDNVTNQIDSVTSQGNISFSDETIFVDTLVSPTGTSGFPEKYGLLKIDDEIITYTGITTNSFTGCIRGFSGISSYITPNNPEQLIFSKTESADHSSGSTIHNLSSLFLKEFLLKIKYQLTPGFENRSLAEGLDESLFIKQSKDFYRSKGTDQSFEILFKSLYGENVSIIRPRDYLFRPSDAQFKITKDLVVESIEGNPEDLENSTLVQDEYLNFTKAYAPVTKVEKIISNEGKEYYKLSIDANYDRDIRVDGALYGEFKNHPQTKVIGQYNSNSSTIDVDSTIGFPLSGELYVKYNDENVGIVSYTSKSINQFFGCTNITGIIEDAAVVGINTFVYGRSFLDQNEIIKVRITSVLKDIDIVSDTFYQKKGYESRIKTLGVNPDNIVSNNWFFNISPNYEVLSIALVDSSNQTYRVNTNSNHIFRIGDNITLKNGGGVETLTKIVDVISSKSFNISGQGPLLISDTYTAKRNILKTDAPQFPNTSIFNTNVQNVYNDRDKTLVASSSLPYYDTQSLEVSPREVVFSGTFSSDEFVIVISGDHGFYTGDAVYYTPQKSGDQILSEIFDEGIYFVKRIDSKTVKFALSRSDIYNSKFISVRSPSTITSNKIELYKFRDKTLSSQNLLREISFPVNDGGTYITEPGFTGILINGVEILNYKSRDVIYSGKLDEVKVIAPGSGFDVINPPTLTIDDPVGSGASAFCAVKGTLNEIRIIDPGFDYDEAPVIKITGGNGAGARAFANMKLIDHESSFNSEINSNQVSLSNNTIGFSTFHKFRNSEKVIYTTNGQRGIGGISTDSSYFVSTQSSTEIKLHRTLNDAVSGINTVQLTSYGIGNHILRSYNKKSIVGSINIENSGFNYENKKRTILSSISTINTSVDEISILNHDFKTGEIINYSTSGTEIGGLTNNTEYYVTVVDSDNFKLSEVGIGLTSKDFYFNTKQYVKITSIGVGIQIFNYPEISVEVIGNVGGVVQLKADIQPIFRGELTSVHLESGGVGYGASEILNYNRQPTFRLNSGSGSQVSPIISNGGIVEVLINSSGRNYNSIPNIEIIGEGVGAVLTPIIEDGRLVEVKVIESGTGYAPNTTSISITAAGSLAEFFAKIQTWNVNLFQKSLPIISEDDGILTEGLNETYELQYSHLYAPRKLREIVYSTNQDGNILYGRKDLDSDFSTKKYHSPIIGWAYDGNPIYGPYGYSTNQGGTVVQMQSGYKIDEVNPKPNRPSLLNFPSGFFVEDYTHFNVSDETILDENNGRFCITPEFPNGTYAYFSTISNLDVDSSGTFSGYKRPVFPFFIGNKFKARPNQFNFGKSSNQDEIDLNQTNWSRNTTPYNLREEKDSYPYLELPNDLDQTIDIKFASSGSVEEIDTSFGGSGYRVGDKLVFNNEGTDGYNASAEVEIISGKSTNSISVASTSIFNLELYPSGNAGSFLLFAENPHELQNTELVSIAGFNTTSSLLEGSYRIGVSTNTIALTSGIGNTSTTGIVTYFSVAGNLNYPNIRENDILRIGSEEVKVLNVDAKSSRIRVLRNVNGTVGSAHSATDVLYELPRKLTINTEIRTEYDSKLNRELYFNPVDSVGLGTTSGIGVGATIVFSNPGVGATQVFIPTRTIYIPNHQLQTGDELVYSLNGGSAIGVSTNGISAAITLTDQSSVYVAKITDDLIGISTFRVGLGTGGTFVGLTSSTSTYGLLYFTNIGSGKHHSFKTTYDTLTGNIFKNTVTVSTANSHGLLNNDVVFIDVNPSIASTVVVKYDDLNRKLLINPKDFLALDVNVNTDTIAINNHEFVRGQKVVHTSLLPSTGLQNNKEYYVVIVDENNIKLSDTYYESLSLKPKIVGITSASFGTLSKINPLIESYKDSSLIFDLSDSSLSYTQQSSLYSAFELRFFKDSNFTELYITNEDNPTFEVQRVGSVGITNDAKVILNINGATPENIYYTLVPVYDNNLPENKRLINTDKEVVSNNEIQVLESKYNGEHKIISTSNSSFVYNVPSKPENNFYTSNISEINYATTSRNTSGPIFKVKILNGGQNYYSLPQVSSVNSLDGSGSIFELSSTSIGKIKKTRINNIGFNFPSDFTLRPSISIPQVIKVDPLSSIKSIEAISFGRGYTTAPKLLVLDGKTNQVVPEVDLNFTLGNNEVEILENTFALNPVLPTILPIQNSNGVGISMIEFNEYTKDVIVTLSVGFSTANAFPFAVNDEILIENIGITSVSEGRGFNSEDYNYQLFIVTSVDENIGGIGGSVTYNMSEFLGDSELPGIFDPDNSSGRIIPQKYFPTFNVSLTKNNYLIGETVTSGSYSGIVEDWDTKTNFVKVVSKNIFNVGEIIKGSTSRTQGIASSVTSFDAFLNLGSVSKFENGWQSAAGFLNDNIQRIQDSLYYQNFSYSLKSRVDFDTWNDVVSTLNHTSGFKKFSDYQLETTVGVGTTSFGLTSIEVISDLIEVVSLNCVYDFDLVRENALEISNRVFSDEIIFSNRILTDYSESVGNRVLSIDDISPEFNSNPRATKYSEVHRFNLTDVRSQKYIAYVTDRRFFNEKQILVITTLIDDLENAYLNQYARVESAYDMGSFDLAIAGPEGILRFYPNKFEVNDFYITTLSYNINDDLSSVGSTSFGGFVDIQSSSVSVSSGSTTIVGIATTYRAAKVLVSIAAEDGKYEFDELTLIHDGTNAELLEYGQLTNHSTDAFSNSGLGTYYPYISGSQLNVDFIPNVGVAATINTINVLFGSTSSVGVSTYEMNHASLQGRSVSIASTSTPVPTEICKYSDFYDGSYLIVQVSDNTNNTHQISEVALIDNDNDVYITEYGNLNTLSGLGTIGAYRSSPSVIITFTPLPNIDVNVKVYLNALRNQDEEKDAISFINSQIQTDHAPYVGTEIDIKRAFNLTHKNDPIFERYFAGDDTSIVSVASSTIAIKNHFFVSGELVKYDNVNEGSVQSIGIATTSFAGIGLTNKLPNEVFIVKVDQNTIQLARTAEDALSLKPKVLTITSVGIGSTHRFTSTNQNSKVIVAIDNVIQSPIVSTAITSTLATSVITTDDIIYFAGITSFFGGDLIKIEDEIMKIESIGVGSTNAIQVRRPWMGTSLAGHSTGTLVKKIDGDYNIVDNVINFITAPYGNIPLSTTTNRPDEVDWEGVSSRSKFQGRTFTRSGIINSSEETYSKNYIFDSISSEFDGSAKDFILTSDGSNVSSIEDGNAIVLVNEILQGPGLSNDYNLSESSGATTISFTGTPLSVSYDVNTASIPRGGIIVSVGSTEGFGYQPLVSAGGTAIVSIAGTISSISIGNSGSGYRQSVQVVNVGIATSNTGTPSIEFIGTAIVSGGNVVSIAITNPGTGYTSTNPPYVVFDAPLSYTNLPLVYSSSSSGVGTGAKINVVVGQGSSVIDFEITNNGYGYGEDQILTIPVGGTAGIPTTGVSFAEFKISIQRTSSDKFAGWSIGELQVLDKLDDKFNDKNTRFSLTISGDIISIISKRGSNINIQDTLLVFINDILQVPGEGYIFTGGSTIRFTEPPKVGDTSKILFYRGTQNVDVVDVNALETVKIGDDLTIGYDSSIGQSSTLQEEERTVTSINSIDQVNTSPYFGPGNTSDENLERPVTWCRQTEDRIIDEQEVAKNRLLYNALINPTSYLINPVGVGVTIVYVDNIRPFFNQINENNLSLAFQNSVTFISQDPKVGASATAIVSIAGTIASVQIVDGGKGYVSSPIVTIQNSVGIGTTLAITASATASTTSGIVTSIGVINPGVGYTLTSPPIILIEPPTLTKEINSLESYEGDFGVIVGISTGSVGVASTAIIFDFYIPRNSFLRDSSITGVTTISGIQTGYYFVTYNSNVGAPTISLDANGIIGIGTTFIDNVYQAASVSIAQTTVIGVGVTYVKRVTVSVQNNNSLVGINSSNFFGEYSWGRIRLSGRSKEKEYSTYRLNGITGLTTSTTIQRTNSLKFSNYIS
jgi:hypothetical protein